MVDGCRARSLTPFALVLSGPSELGAFADEVLWVLRSAVLNTSARVLDLGCGKGEAAVAVARSVGCTVLGVDAMSEFVASARDRALEDDVARHCIFVQDDLRRVVASASDYDLVCPLALRDILGTTMETVSVLRACVKVGGYILIDDAFLRDGASVPIELEGCAGHQETLEILCAVPSLVPSGCSNVVARESSVRCPGDDEAYSRAVDEILLSKSSDCAARVFSCFWID